MKLIYAIVSDEDSPRLTVELNQSGYRVTKLHTTGGFLRSGNTTLMIVVEDEVVANVLEIIRKYSRSRKAAINANMSPSGMGSAFIPYPVEVQVGGATIFIVNVEYFEKA